MTHETIKIVVRMRRYDHSNTVRQRDGANKHDDRRFGCAGNFRSNPWWSAAVTLRLYDKFAANVPFHQRKGTFGGKYRGPSHQGQRYR